MAGVLSKGITLSYNDTKLTNLMEIPELGGSNSSEAVEITTLDDASRVYMDGINNYGDSLVFKFLYEETQFTTLNGLKDSQQWKVELPDGASCTFGGTCNVKLDGAAVNAALTYSLTVRPDSSFVWA